MIIIKTSNGVRFINEAETLQVSHFKSKATVEVWPSRWSNNCPEQQFFEICCVESVIYTNAAQATEWQDEGSEVEKLKKSLKDTLELYKKMRDEYLTIEQERDDLKERLAKIEIAPNDYENDRLIDTVYIEMDRIATANRERQKEQNPGWHQFQKNGNAVRFMNVAKDHDIETVGQLLKVGRVRFEQFHQMGKKCIMDVSQALKNLYGIKQW